MVLRFFKLFFAALVLVSSCANAQDDFFDFLRSALESVGVPADEYPQRATLLVDSPRFANLGRGDFIDYAVVDLGGKGSGDSGYLAELLISFPIERLIPGEGPLQRIYQVNAIQEMQNELLQHLASITEVKSRYLLVDPSTSGIRFGFMVPRDNVLIAAQEIMNAILDARHMMRELSLRSDPSSAGDCSGGFSRLN